MDLLLNVDSLREMRNKNGLKRSYVAEKLQISPDYLNLIERGERPLNVPKIEILANLYKTSYIDLALSALKTYKKYM